MEESSKKKKYESPKVYRVVLNHDQAILSGCSTASTSLSNNTNTWCRNTGTTCRKTNATTSVNSAASS